MARDKKTSFQNLTPDRVFQSLEDLKLHPTGRCLQLNSYENRVFEIELEDREPIVIKYYRPGRWSRQTIQDEHDFLEELAGEGIPVVAPEKYNGETITEFDQLFMTVFPKAFGRLPDEFINDELKSVGRRLAQIHNVGAKSVAPNRHSLTTKDLGDPALKMIDKYISPEMAHRYMDAAEVLLDCLDDLLEPSEFIRIHGDCHRGNLLNNGDEFFFVDFDDFCNGPISQDFWMLLDSCEFQEEADKLIDGYCELREWPKDYDALAPALRGLRLVHYSGWIAKRWDDPSFPRLFPNYETYNYWAEETERLEEIVRTL